jgi:Glycosyl transferase family 2
MASISVALCTFNGAHYLAQQLESLLGQTRQPDEVVVCDDGSEDETLRILRRWAAEVPFPVAIRENPARLGVFRNFEQAVALCDGELIAPCDQDDVWQAEKLAVMEQVLEDSPQAGLAFSNAEVVNEQLELMEPSLWDCAGFSPQVREEVETGDAFRNLVNRNFIFGCTMVFRAQLRELFLPFPREFEFIHLHDGLMALFTAAVAPVIPVEQMLVRYRQHAGQQIGAFLGIAEPRSPTLISSVEKFSAQMSYREYIAYLRVVQTRLMDARGRYACEEALEDLRRRIRHFQARDGMPAGRVKRLPVIAKELAAGHYTAFSNGVLSAIKDACAKL